MDERDISAEKSWFYAERAKAAVSNLKKRNIDAQFTPGRKEALSAVLEMIPEGATIVCGDSISVEQIGVIEALKKRNLNKVINPLERDASGNQVFSKVEERRRMQREAFSSDIFLTGTNAVTLDGKLVNTDGVGNRVSPMIFGPNKVIIVAGINKIVRDVNEALERIHTIAAPMNAKRHYLKHHRTEYGDLPCVRTGMCVDCNHDLRICRFTVIIEGTKATEKGRIAVVLVGEELGI